MISHASFSTLHAPRLVCLLAALPLLATGCRTNPTAGFKDVQQNVASRTGQTPEWPQTSAEIDRADASVRELISRELTIDNTVQIALLNNRSLRATLEELGISRAEVIQAGLPRNPQFFASFRFPDRPPSGTDIEYSIAQDFLDLLLLPLKKRLAQVQLEQTKLRLSHHILQLIAEVKTAFFTVQARQQLIKRLEAITDLNEAGADLASRQRKAGNITALEVANEAAVFQQAKIELARTGAQLRVDRERLNRLLGLWGPNTAWKIADSLPPLPAAEAPIEHVETLAIKQRLDLAAAQQQVAIAAYSLNLRGKTRYLPASVNIGIDTERGPDPQRVTGPTLDLELPIFDHGQADILRLNSQYRQAQERLEALATDIRSEVRQARDSLIAARDLTEFYRTIYLPQRIRILNETQLQYNAMQDGPFQLISAKERELTAEREYADAWRDYWIARAELEKAVGGRLSGEIPLAPSGGERDG